MKSLKIIQAKLFLAFVFTSLLAFFYGFFGLDHFSFLNASIWSKLGVLLFVTAVSAFCLIKKLGKELSHWYKSNQTTSEETILQSIDSAKKCQELLNLFADVVYRLDAYGRIIYVKHSEKLFGYTDQDLIGKDCFELVHVDDRLQLQKKFQAINAKTNKLILNYKLRIVTKSGDVRYCLLSNRTIFKNGILIGGEGVIRDITENEQLSQKVEIEKEKLQTMYNNLHNSYLALGKVNAQIAALAEINTTFSSNLTWKEKLYYIIESIRAFMHADETLLFVQDQVSQKFTLKHASVDFDFWDGIELNQKTPLLKKIIKDKKFIEYGETSQFLDESRAKAKHYCMMFAIPVIVNNRVVGVFIVFFKNLEKAQNFPTKLALAYTSQMSIALMMSGELDHSLKKIF